MELQLWRKKPVYPIEKQKFLNRVSQRFGLPSTRRRSGIHNGLDLALPLNTPVFAPADGEVYQVYSNHKTMGNALYYRCSIGGRIYYMRFLHLLRTPLLGKYNKGDIMGATGQSGESTAPHLHIEVWRRPIDIKVLYSEQTVRSALVDPFAFFRYEVDGIIV